MAQILMPLPDHDFDVTETAIPWQLAVDTGHEVIFATESGGQAAQADQRLIDGVIFGQLGAEPDAIVAYHKMIESPAFQKPRSWLDLDSTQFDGLILPGGHAPRMRQYLGSEALQDQVLRFWKTGKPVGAICHGVLVLARTIDPVTQKSVIYQ